MTPTGGKKYTVLNYTILNSETSKNQKQTKASGKIGKPSRIPQFQWLNHASLRQLWLESHWGYLPAARPEQSSQLFSHTVTVTCVRAKRSLKYPPASSSSSSSTFSLLSVLSHFSQPERCLLCQPNQLFQFFAS